MNEALRKANEKREKERAINKKDSKAFKGKEKDLQKMCENYLNLIGLRYLHIPDNVLRYLTQTAPIWIRAIMSKAFKGVPDLMIFRDDKCLHIELKTATGKLSQGQKNWHKGITVHVVRSFEDFKKLVDEF